MSELIGIRDVLCRQKYTCIYTCNIPAKAHGRVRIRVVFLQYITDEEAPQKTELKQNVMQSTPAMYRRKEKYVTAMEPLVAF